MQDDKRKPIFIGSVALIIAGYFCYRAVKTMKKKPRMTGYNLGIRQNLTNELYYCSDGLTPKKQFGANPAFKDLHLFDLPEDIVYFNNPSFTLKHKTAIDEGVEALQQSMQVWRREPCKKQNIKKMFAEIVNGAAEDVAIFPCTSHGISLLAFNLAPQLKKGDKILLVKGQFMSNCIPWTELCERAGTEMLIVDTPADLLSANWEDVKIVATFQCMWSDGALTDLLQLRERCNSVGAKLIVDATQSIGVMKFDVKEIKPDAVCASVHKWLGGVHGASLMWLDPEFRKGFRPLDHNERNRKNPGVCDSQVGYNNELVDGAGCLDAGGRPNPTLLPVLNASIIQVLNWGIPNIAAHTEKLTKQISERAREMDMCFPKDHSPHIIGIRYPEPNSWKKTEQLQKYLKERKMYTSFRLGFIRIGVWVYNTKEDVERFFAAIKEFEKEPAFKDIDDMKI